MKSARYFRIDGGKLATIFAIVTGLSIASSYAQSPGNNAVYNSTGTLVTASAAFIDATAFASPSTTICQTIYNILSPGTYPANGAIIDARGLTGGSGGNSNFTCNTSESPWLSAGTYVNKPSVILLPAGTISIPYTWVIANNTRIIGQGASVPVASGLPQTGTILVAAPGFGGPGPGYANPVPLAMIQFGDPLTTLPSACNGGGICFNISIEDVTLNASGEAIDGILNINSQELTYARRVNIYGVTGTLSVPSTGLQIGYKCPVGVNCNYPFQGQNSGPYEQISFTASTTSAYTYCAQIYGAGTRGIHGIKCTGASGNAGILLDSASNSIEDVVVNGFTDGVLVGSQSSSSLTSTVTRAWGNLLSNVSGSTSVTNLIHVCGAAASGNCPAGQTATPQDLTIVAATSAANNTILDDVTGTTLTNTKDAKVGIYALGEPVSITSAANGTSRFTTSGSTPTWFIGNTSSPPTPCSNGSIYSSTAAGTTVWGCISGLWQPEK